MSAGVDDPLLPRLRHLLAQARRIAVLTGAGMSAESGIATFRGAADSLWSRWDPYRLASPEGWAEDRALVWAWYRWRRAQARRAQPHAGHRALARLGQRRALTVVTQNVDDLHERAGSRDVIHLHGELFALRCDACGRAADAASRAAAEHDEGSTPGADNAAAASAHPLRVEPLPCAHCGGRLRPGVVWFGEALPAAAWEAAVDAIRQCEVLLVVGTSLQVHPAAGLVPLAREGGACVIELNPEPGAAALAQHVWRTTAARGLPLLLDAAHPDPAS